MEIRGFVVGVDDSVPGRAAIRWAVAHARELRAEVLLVHVVADDGSADERAVDARELLASDLEYARTFIPEVPVRGELRSGSPMMELAAYSGPETMLVVGTHKTGFHYGRAVGSRSLQLANLVTGPVAIIPETAARLRRGVVVGVDDTVAGNQAIDLAADLACDRGCELLAVRSSNAPAQLDNEREDLHLDRQLRRDDDARGLLAVAVERARQRQPGIVIRSRVVRRPAGAALNELARGAELLVIGDSRRAQAQLGSLGAVAYDVLLNLSSPTIVTHAPALAGSAPSLRTEGEPRVGR